MVRDYKVAPVSVPSLRVQGCDCAADACVVVYLTYPETSLTISLTNAVLLLRWPFMRETRGFGWRGVTFCIIEQILAFFSTLYHILHLLLQGLSVNLRGQH